METAKNGCFVNTKPEQHTIKKVQHSHFLKEYCILLNQINQSFNHFIKLSVSIKVV